jgi:hypothetical protein
MAIKSEISWKRRTREGVRVEVYARRFGGVWKFHMRSQRYEEWTPIDDPSLEDWQHLLDAIRRRVPRRLFPPQEVTRVLQEIRERYPEYAEGDTL